MKQIKNNAAILLTFIIKPHYQMLGFLFLVKECLATLQNKYSNRKMNIYLMM
ncbi:hypothetical protein KPK_1831 [Klebsiella variicola]|uniref:Uncharacterized protein n=1 Tax=Klebsiella variicola (strain 342) TaxID=507522 RepID=B5XPT2_KLEV3|nr:hypothetical protein KPK_1831 [Klebsiella variicola]